MRWLIVGLPLCHCMSCMRGVATGMGTVFPYISISEPPIAYEEAGCNGSSRCLDCDGGTGNRVGNDGENSSLTALDVRCKVIYET